VFAEDRLRRLQGEERNRMARDSYSYLHLPIIAGIVLFALGAKKTLAHVTDPLHGLGAVALGLGPALVLGTLSLLRWRHIGAHNRLRLGAAALCLCMSAVAAKHSALAAMLGIALILAGLIGAERVWSRRMQRLGAS
jgi:low temperature requirement protein LtrA